MLPFKTFTKSPPIALLITVLLLSGCTGAQKTATTNQDSSQKKPAMQQKTPVKTSYEDRMIPNPITGEIPPGFFNAVESGTRTMSGKPGPEYWSQRADYDIDVELVPADTMLKGSSTITYHNNSPDTLNRLFMELTQNFHKKGVVRNESTEITGGVNLKKVSVQNRTLKVMQSSSAPQGYYTDGTLMIVRPPENVAPGETVTIAVDWDFKIPQQGAGGRMGYSNGNLFYIGYWYPKMRVYDDVNGWSADPFQGTAEFYHDFGNYDVNIAVPEQWMVASTGRHTNAQNVLRDDIYQRLQKAHSSDKVVNVVTKEDFGKVTQTTDSNTVTWSFKAENVRDFAFSATKESMWDATRSKVPDRDGDGQPDYVNINAIYRSSAPLWTNGAAFTSDAISFLSNFTGLAYPWPHMTSVEGGGIIGGGMEYPMMTLIGAYNGQSAQSLYAVIAHELSHMWVPMQISSNERRYAWMDEGTTTFNESQAKKAKYPGGNFEQADFRSYLNITDSGLEGPIMRWSDYHYNGFAYGVASYPKPGSMMLTLRGLLGEDTFQKAYETYLIRWRYRHPYPWDLFNTFEDVSGRDLDWFWRSWFYETWTLDQAVGAVQSSENSTDIIIEDHGQVPMPATVEITLDDGSILTREIPVDTWLEGAAKTKLTVDNKSSVVKVVIDPKQLFPDANRVNNSWEK